MDTSSLIHDFFSKECDECVHLVVDTTLNTDKVANTKYTNDFISFISGSSSGGGSSSYGSGGDRSSRSNSK